eukprot:11157166-Lingulodinium_polyedra.AAC.1
MTASRPAAASPSCAVRAQGAAGICHHEQPRAAPASGEVPRGGAACQPPGAAAASAAAATAAAAGGPAERFCR